MVSPFYCLRIGVVVCVEGCPLCVLRLRGYPPSHVFAPEIACIARKHAQFIGLSLAALAGREQGVRRVRVRSWRSV